MKFELNLTQNEHQYLLTASSHDRKLRFLQAFAKACFMRGLDAEAGEYLGTRRREATALLVGRAKGRNP